MWSVLTLQSLFRQKAHRLKEMINRHVFSTVSYINTCRITNGHRVTGDRTCVATAQLSHMFINHINIRTLNSWVRFTIQVRSSVSKSTTRISVAVKRVPSRTAGLLCTRCAASCAQWSSTFQVFANQELHIVQKIKIERVKVGRSWWPCTYDSGSVMNVGRGLHHAVSPNNVHEAVEFAEN